MDLSNTLGIDFFSRLLVMLIGLKLMNVVNIPWVVVLLPLWLPVVGVMALYVIGRVLYVKK